jgi:hypothetical protein
MSASGMLGRLWSTVGAEPSWSIRLKANSTARQGKAITNFNRALPGPQSDLVEEVTKDPYNFDFLMLGKETQR